MRRGRPVDPITLTPGERAVLERWARRAKTALAQRARIVLACAAGVKLGAVAEQVGVTRQTVGRWRRRFVRQRVEGLLDEPRPGAPRRTTEAQAERVIRLTLEETPRNATQWSTRSMAERCGLSQSAVSRIWRAFALQPHRAKIFHPSKDSLFIEKVRDIVGLYLNPPNKALALCTDEKCQFQAPGRTHPLLPVRASHAEHRTPDDSRYGTASLFADLDVKTGTVIGECPRRHRTIEFRKFLDRIEQAVPADLDVHLILNNYKTYKTLAIHRWLVRHPRFHLHVTPAGVSWTNLVERWFGVLADKPIRRGAHRSTFQLEVAILRHIRYIEDSNQHLAPFVWTKKADEILASVARFC